MMRAFNVSCHLGELHALGTMQNLKYLTLAIHGNLSSFKLGHLKKASFVGTLKELTICIPDYHMKFSSEWGKLDHDVLPDLTALDKLLVYVDPTFGYYPSPESRSKLRDNLSTFLPFAEARGILCLGWGKVDDLQKDIWGMGL